MSAPKWKCGHDLFGGGRGGDVEVCGCFAEQQVADAAAGPERLVARLPQPTDDLQAQSHGMAAFHSFTSSPRPPAASALSDTTELSPLSSWPAPCTARDVTLIAMRVSP